MIDKRSVSVLPLSVASVLLFLWSVTLEHRCTQSEEKLARCLVFVRIALEYGPKLDLFPPAVLALYF